jgi:hypothetical protein
LRTLEQELAAARAAAGAQGDDADKTLLPGQVLALQQQVALLTCPAASDAPHPAVSPPVVRGRDKEGDESRRERESRRARERESERVREVRGEGGRGKEEECMVVIPDTCNESLG